MKITLRDLGITVELYLSNKAICKEPTCRKEIFWITSPITNSRIPITKTEDGEWISHFKDCTRPDRFSSKYEKNND